MLSWILIVGGLAMLVEGCAWARRKGVELNPVTVVMLSIVLPVVDLGRLSLAAGRWAWRWLIAPDVLHARTELARRRNRRQYIRQTPVARAVIEANPVRQLPPAAPAALPPPPAVPVVHPAAAPVATAVQVRLPDGTVQWQPMELYG